MRLGATLRDRNEDLYHTEGILARELVRLKRATWYERWYRSSGSPGDARAGAGAGLTGTFEGVVHDGHVPDVFDFWRGAGVLRGHVDLSGSFTPQVKEPALAIPRSIRSPHSVSQ